MASARVELDPRWGGVDGVFGGHVLATLADAATSGVQAARLASLMVCFVASVKPGAAVVETESLHDGRTAATSRLALIQEDRVRAHAFAEFFRGTGETRWTDQIDVPDRPAAGFEPPDERPGLAFRERFEMVLLERSAPGVTGGAWVRLREDPSEVGLASPEAVLAALLDVMPPALYMEPVRPIFVPTLAFAAHFRTDSRVDPAGWFYLTHRTAWANDQTCIEDAAVHDAEGRLLAQGRQTRTVRWPA